MQQKPLKFAENEKMHYLCTRILSHGVMVALQFLVLSVVVRVRLGQRRGRPGISNGIGPFFN